MGATVDAIDDYEGGAFSRANGGGKTKLLQLPRPSNEQAFFHVVRLIPIRTEVNEAVIPRGFAR